MLGYGVGARHGMASIIWCFDWKLRQSICCTQSQDAFCNGPSIVISPSRVNFTALGECAVNSETLQETAFEINTDAWEILSLIHLLQSYLVCLYGGALYGSPEAPDRAPHMWAGMHAKLSKARKRAGVAKIESEWPEACCDVPVARILELHCTTHRPHAAGHWIARMHCSCRSFQGNLENCRSSPGTCNPEKKWPEATRSKSGLVFCLPWINFIFRTRRHIKKLWRRILLKPWW